MQILSSLSNKLLIFMHYLIFRILSTVRIPLYILVYILLFRFNKFVNIKCMQNFIASQSCMFCGLSNISHGRAYMVGGIGLLFTDLIQSNVLINMLSSTII